MGEEEYRELLNYLRAYTAPPMIVPYEEPRIEFVRRDVNVAFYDEEQEPCTDEELQEFLFSS